MMSICSHVIAANVQLVKDTYDKDYLERLLEKLTTKKRAAHRPLETRGALRMQPHGDSASEDEEEEGEEAAGAGAEVHNLDMS